MIDYKEASAKVLDAVRAIALADGVNTDQGETIDRAMVKLLGLAWCDAVRAEWQTFVDADPELKAQMAVAKELMIEDGYDALDPICMLPGRPAMIAKIDNQDAVCVDHCMAQVTPLSAMYVNKVRIVQSAAARASKALMDEAAKAAPEWPMTIASGETFNSIEEMEASPIDAVKEMAKMMRAAPPPYTMEVIGTIHIQPTCWQFFDFDGPVSLDSLQLKYREKIMVIGLDNALVAATHKQYQNCLKELGAAIMGGSKDE